MKKVVRGFLASILCLSGFILNANEWVLPIRAAETCDSIESCDAAKAEIAKQKKGIQGKIDAAKTDADAQYDALYAINEKTGILESEISLLNESIILLQEKETQLAEQIKETEDALLSRYKMQQTEGTTNPFLQLLVNSKSIPDLMRKWQIMGKFNDDDSKIVEKITVQRAEIIVTQDQQKLDKENVEASKIELENVSIEMKAALKQLISKQEELEAQMEDVAFTEAELDKQKDAAQKYKEQLEKEEAEREQAEKEAEEEANKPQPGEGSGNEGGQTPDPEPKPKPKPPVSQTWYNPIQGNPIPVTCPIGCYSGHIGVDFGAYYTTVSSIARGKVLYASYGWNGGFGNMVVMYHYIDGQDYVTIYGHLSEVWVSEGQEVNGGSGIGVSGNTGTSTGPHLHLEIVAGLWYYPSRYEREVYGRNVLNYIPGGFVYW